MNSVGKTLIVLSIFFAAGYALKCRQCPIGAFGSCIIPFKTTCSSATERCYKGEAHFTATAFLKLHSRGCLESNRCGKTLTGTILNAEYTSTYNCCNTTLCNSASSLHVSVTVGTLLTLLSMLWVSQ